ncbi:MAG: bifunctional 4-hydroxy-2-oxoglutarate aldolase/2-dehydro-3-deoxy-phosphogluconate aldolase [Candidatus Acidiferrum sp.]
MNKSETCARIQEVGIIPAVRVSSAEEAHFAAEAVCSGGIPIVEITLTVARAVELIAHLSHYHPKMVVGAGTVLSTDVAQKCLDAGASFLTSPGLNLKVVEFAAKNGIAALPGALTPTEVIEAWEAGADFVKVFPCIDVGGERYIKALKTALPQIPLVAAGGVNQQTAENYILAGASAIGVGHELIPPEAIERRQAKRIKELSLRFAGFVKEARERIEPPKPVAVSKFKKIEECEKE